MTSQLVATPTLTNEQLYALRVAPLGAMPNKVRLARTMLNRRSGEVARAVKLAVNTYSHIENGKTKGPELQSAGRLADYFGAQIEDLFPTPEAA